MDRLPGARAAEPTLSILRLRKIGQTGWGLGFAQKITEDYTMHMHTGNNHDFQAYAMFIPEKNYGLVVFTNSDKMIPFLTNLSEVLGPQF